MIILLIRPWGGNMTSIKRVAGAVALGAVLLLGLSSAPAQAGYVVTLTEQSGNVVASGSGALDVTGFSFATASPFPSQIAAGTSGTALIFGAVIGTSNGNNIGMSFTPVNGPNNFGPGSTNPVLK